MDYTFDQQELELLLKEHHDSAIWSQKMNQGKLWPKVKYAFFLLILICFVLCIIVFFNSESPEFIREVILNVLIWFAVISTTLINYNIAASLVYTIFPAHISFEWGLFKKKKVDIPFSDITAIELVRYTDKDISTIHFGTSQEYKIKKIDFDSNDSRPHITFEKITNGIEVYELLRYLHDAAQKRG